MAKAEPLKNQTSANELMSSLQLKLAVLSFSRKSCSLNSIHYRTTYLFMNRGTLSSGSITYWCQFMRILTALKASEDLALAVAVVEKKIGTFSLLSCSSGRSH